MLSNSQNSYNVMPKLMLLIVVCCSLWPQHSTHSTPIKTRRSHIRDGCPHDSIGELIKNSPVILKALGARIFTDDDLNAFQQQQQQIATVAKNAKNNILTTTTVQPNGVGTTTLNDSKIMPSLLMSPTPAESILITLTPETIYKGASLLKVTPNGGGGDGARNGGFVNGDSASESAYHYEGQLNATLEPLYCFDSNVVKMLPSVLIAFGKLVTVQQQQHQQLFHPQQQQHEDVLHISINGLHRWSPQFEAHIWKHLGWDDWSDFTICSVTCGKGVQQRFRRCLLDNPMMNLNMNMKFNNDDDVGDEDVVDENVTADDDVDDAIIGADGDVEFIADEQQPHLAVDSMHVSQNGNANPTKESVSSPISNMNDIELDGVVVTAAQHELNGRSAFAKNKNNTMTTHDDVVSVDSGVGVVDELFEGVSPSSTAIDNNELNNESTIDAATTSQSDGEVMRFSECLLNKPENSLYEQNNGNGAHLKRKRKHRKASKTLSTLFCEGYNIEQRNCNTFECSDDISDLLKFYKRLASPYDDTSSSSIGSAQLPTTSSQSLELNASPVASKQNRDDTEGHRDADANSFASAAPSMATTPGGAYANSSLSIMPSSTPANMGYIKFWHNSLNFTLMLTLRVKNDSRKATATIFSIRNSTHNLYLESCKDGLRLYLERDNSTEMLPVKFNLYDYRWHQVSISIQNGDFISIYVDCSWTNSFVVSKRLFSLPLDADVEIGRGFNGELQQLLVLPDNQERHQCSNKRTSINEVKRYIIDTFIDDYSN